MGGQSEHCRFKQDNGKHMHARPANLGSGGSTSAVTLTLAVEIWAICIGLLSQVVPLDDQGPGQQPQKHHCHPWNAVSDRPMWLRAPVRATRAGNTSSGSSGAYVGR